MSRRWGRALFPGWMGILSAGCSALGDPRLADPSPAARDERVGLPLSAGPAATTRLLPTALTSTLIASAASSGAAEPTAIAVSAAPGIEASKPSVVWRFRSAAPVSGPPAVSPAGLVYVATVEGYVHALEPDGAFRWSYGIAGIPIGAPAVDASSQVYVATSMQRLYALRPDGRLGWMQRVPTRFAAAPIWVPPGFIYFLGRDQSIHSLAAWNSPPSGHHLEHAANAELASLGDGLVALGTAAPDVRVYRRSSLIARVALESELLQPPLGGKEHWFAVTRSGLAAFDATTHALVWSAPARRAGASADEQTLVVEVERELLWLVPQTGKELYRAPLPGDVSAPFAVTNDGVALVPMVSGELLMIEPRGRLLGRVEVARAPTWTPVWSETNRRVTAAAGAEVVGLDLSAWSHAPDDEPPVELPDDPSPQALDDPGGTGFQRFEARAPDSGGTR